jgi:hypothetical protein
VQERNCTVVEASPKVPQENIDYLVPTHFRHRLQPDPQGLVTLLIDLVRCEIKVGDGEFHPETHAAFRVPLKEDTPDDPSSPVVHVDDYQLWIAADDQKLIDVFRREGDAGNEQAKLVKNLVFDLAWDATGTTGTFTFEAPEPAPSPFKIAATVHKPVVGPLDLSNHHYGGPPGWMVIETVAFKGLRLGPAQGTIVFEPSSQLGQVLCDPDGQVEFDEGLVVTSDPEDSGSYKTRVQQPLPPPETSPQATCPPNSPM